MLRNYIRKGSKSIFFLKKFFHNDVSSINFIVDNRYPYTQRGVKGQCLLDRVFRTTNNHNTTSKKLKLINMKIIYFNSTHQAITYNWRQRGVADRSKMKYVQYVLQQQIIKHQTKIRSTGNSRNWKILTRKIHLNNSKLPLIFVNFKLG